MELARIDQTDSSVQKRVAEIVRKKGQLNEAAYWYRQAIFINPFDVKLHEALAGVHAEASDYGAALREWEMVTRLDPNNAAYLEAAAVAALKSGDRESAQRFAARAVSLNPASNITRLLEASGTNE